MSEPQEGPLAGRLVLVTGAASGTGRSITGRFLADGATVLAAGFDGTGLQALHQLHGERLVAPAE